MRLMQIHLPFLLVTWINREVSQLTGGPESLGCQGPHQLCSIKYDDISRDSGILGMGHWVIFDGNTKDCLQAIYLYHVVILELWTFFCLW